MNSMPAAMGTLSMQTAIIKTQDRGKLGGAKESTTQARQEVLLSVGGERARWTWKGWGVY